MNEIRPCYHEPVLVKEILDALQPRPGLLLVDATLGGGGHSEALLKAGAKVIGLDQDPEAIAEATRRLTSFGGAFETRHGNFSHIDQAIPGKVDGVLMDLGVSSRHLDAAERGFSFMRDGPLDMRMDTTCGPTAADLLNSASEEEIMRWLREYGDEPRARPLVRALIREREKRPLGTTFDLVRIVEMVHGKRGTRSHHPATLTFQAVRMAVNRELEVLDEALPKVIALLNPGGRLAVISFHALEDRKVKTFLREASREWEDTPAWPSSVPNPRRVCSLITRKAITAQPEEIARNPRARSAKLRVAERLSAASITTGGAS